MNQKAPACFEAGAFDVNPAASYSSIERLYSTIGAGGLNGRVRDGIGCDTSAIATGNFSVIEKGHLLRCARFAHSNVLIAYTIVHELRAPRYLALFERPQALLIVTHRFNR